MDFQSAKEIESFYNFVKLLPDPNHKQKIGKANFEIYLAKSFLDKEWKSGPLKELTRVCRTAFFRYGYVPEFDDHDDFASTYLVRAKYKENSKKHEEWLSVRFVFSKIGDNNNEDLHVSSYKEQSITDIIVEKFSDFKKGETTTFSISRLCGTPVFVNEDSFMSVPGIKRKKFTIVSFALAQKAFFDFCKRKNVKPTIFSVRFRKELVNKSFEIKCGDDVLKFNLKTAYETLGLSPSHKISYNREIWSYRCPSYHLDIFELLNLLKDLINKKIITQKTINFYTDIGMDLKNFNKQDFSYFSLIHKLRKLGNLLTHKGRFHDSYFSGEELRKLVDKYVSDGPTLYLLPSPWWEQEVDKFISEATLLLNK